MADGIFGPLTEVSIHAPAWGATLSSFLAKNVSSVSIHAPAWGATLVQFQLGGYILVSIHAPAWGATSPTLPGAMPPMRFNPRSRVGSDFINHHITSSQYVSIHAPAWGATCRSFSSRLRIRFQSTLPRGERRFFRILFAASIWFQSTLPRGERPSNK
ncbi:hypothetical cytosolic protein [Bacteroides sp. CAG:927]|nr:hypothetical cytosolic protein [Bacteroides sp. CAG:927]